MYIYMYICTYVCIDIIYIYISQMMYKGNFNLEILFNIYRNYTPR